MPKRRVKPQLVGLLFLAPLMLGLFIFRVFAFLQNVYLSFTEAGALIEPKFIGLENYVNIFSDPNFWQALGNTLKYFAIGLPIILILSLISAVLLNNKMKHISVFRVIYFIPAIILPVAAIQVFMWLFHTDYGLINSLLVNLGWEKVSWFSNNAGVTFVMSLTTVYLNVSVPTFILLGGLQEIPESYYESASLDGASPLRQFFCITLPLLTPSIFNVLIISSINLFKLFDVPYTMLGNNKAALRFGKTIVYYFYENAFEFRNTRGYAAAMSMVFFLMVLVFTILMFRWQWRWVNYER